MERSANSKDVNNYSILAKYYDELIQDVEALSLWLKYIEEKDFKTVLELASGSGVLAGILKNKGYDVTASDISEDMKNVSKDNFDGEYLLLNMIDYHLGRKYDLVLCICDSINYLETDELDSFFRCAYEHLNEKGRLIFDMHHPARIDEFEDEYVEEGYVLNTPYQWTILSDKTDKTVMEHFTFYTKEAMIQEHHTQNVFDVNDIKDKMSRYFNVRVIEDFVEDEKILVIGERK
ncbi:MAG: class I SAM-dependent methyltransferase [Erysipelotrichaceae bacterium]|nr:class I SAM-dependent methyltransferase [Erysipelotrichaceae bacterium]